MKTVSTSHFARKQHTPESAHSHFDGPWSALENVCAYSLEHGDFKQGYRPGVMIVTGILPTYFYTSLAKLEAGQAVYGKVERRENTHPAEAPIKSTFCYGKKTPAKYVEIVLYSRDTLLEDHDPSELTGGDYEIVTILASPIAGTTPMPPMTLVRNWLHLPGGTEMKGVTPEQALKMLCESVQFWSEYGLVKDIPTLAFNQG
jgi:hypothetical protein